MIVSLFYDQHHFTITLISLYFTFAKYIQITMCRRQQIIYGGPCFHASFRMSMLSHDVW